MPKNFRFILVASLFIISGIAALIYQVVWFRQLSYFLGSTTYSQSVVLATFMGGLAIGSWFWGKKADKTKNNLRLFALLEIALAIYCFLYTTIFSATESFFINIVRSNELDSDSSFVFVLKFLVSVLTILLPTILMGGTLPVLVKYLSKSLKSVGRNVAILYFINSLGAVIGSILAGFYLLQSFGLEKTTYLGAFLELLVGLVCLFLSFKTPIEKEEIDVKNENESKQLFSITPSQLKIAFWVAGFTGLCSMIYEIVWLRLLIPILSSSTYSFTLVLAAFIGGITIGSLIIFRLNEKIKNPYRLLGFLQLAIVISIIVTLPFYERLPYFLWKTIGDPLIEKHTYSFYLTMQFLYVFLILFLPTLFMGMSLPLASRLVVTRIDKSGTEIGSVFGINTIGTVIGSILSGLILIPLIGIRYTLLLAILINLTLAIIVLKDKTLLTKKTRMVLGTFTVLIMFLFIRNLTSNSWAYSIMLSEVPRKINRKNPPFSYEEFVKLSHNHEKILYYKEGIGGTIVVAQNKGEIYLFTNGKGDANSVGDLRTQVSLGQTPVILHPSADSVFVIGYGAGTTIGNVVSHPNVKYAEVAEISGEVIDASVHFNSINQEPLKSKKLKVIKDDGVSALRLSPKKYDLIISQPSNPWSAGVGNLFTTEFFRDCKSKLRPGGYVAQWFSLYEMNDKSLKLIIRTAMDQFKHVSLWHIGTNDILLLCSEEPFNFNLKTIEKNFNLVQDNMSQINIHNFPTFLSQQIISSEEGIIDYAGTGQINSEDKPLLELWAPEAYYNNSTPVQFAKLDERKKFAESKLLLKKYMDKKGGLTKDEMLQIGLFQSTGGNKELAFYMADKNPEIYVAWSQKASQAGDQKMALEFLNMAAKKGKSISKDELFKQRAIMLGKEGDLTGALREIELAIQENPKGAELYYQKGTFLLSMNQLEEAVSALEKSISLEPNLVDSYNNLAIIKGKQQKYLEVVELLNKAESISKTNPKIYFNRGYAKGFLQDFNGAVADFSKVIELDPNNGQALVLRGRAFISLGKKVEACTDFSKAKTLNTPGAAESLSQFCN